ncbi:MAG: endonuclease/exonuclease/phosphatase family protein [Flavobacteriaceae bacterium]|nr:endonuclease/exonuclease/phosphatase family protein [Flavobacteriaceae bacterium]
MKHLFLFIITFFLIGNVAFSQDKKYQIRTLAFYNLENLFDTINNTAKNDEASPMMELKGNRSKVYWDKIDKLGSVLSRIGVEKAKNSPAIIGVVEVENDTVLRDLVAGKFLKKKKYSIIHYESPDKRGIDVGLLYQPRYFKPVNHQSFELLIYDNEGERIFTRDQLLVSGYLDGEMIHIIVNHWPSKRGGTRSIPFREKAAKLNLKIMKQIRENEPNAKIITMGDFNDDPIESSFKKIMKTKRKKKNVKENDIYNPFEDMFIRGFNTAGYRDNINLFDQILISSQLLATNKDFSTYKMHKAGIYNPKYLINSKGRYKGYPFRSFSWGTYTGGYSDHYPSYMYLIKEKK